MKRALVPIQMHSEVEYCGCQLLCKFNEPLEVGSVYEMIWVLFPNDTIVEKSILTHIGFLRCIMWVSEYVAGDRFFC